MKKKIGDVHNLKTILESSICCIYECKDCGLLVHLNEGRIILGRDGKKISGGKDDIPECKKPN